jgi:hypothetical protein
LKRLEDGVSKVVDENGEPIVVFHGSNVDFNLFENKPREVGRRKTSAKGFYFTKDKWSATQYAGSDGFVKSYFLKILNYPSKKDKKVLEYSNIDDYLFDYGQTIDRFGYDGAIDVQGDFIVWNPEQIKLADGTNTTFDSNNPDIRFNEGGKIELNEESQQLVDIISMNPNSDKYQKYKDILLNKFGINFDDYYKDDYYIENANLSDIKRKDDFVNYDKYIEYAKKIFKIRGLFNDYHAQNIEGIITIDEAKEIGDKLDFKIINQEYSGGAENYASHSIDVITIPNEVDINTFVHEIGHHYDHFESKEYEGLANTSTYASSLYEIGKSDEVFAENFKNYFISPNWLKEKLPMVYSELDTNINEKYKKVILKLIDDIKQKYNYGGQPINKETMNPKDTITMNVPLFIRMLELAREDIKSDEQLHRLVENIIDLKDNLLTMDDYDEIVMGIIGNEGDKVAEPIENDLYSKVNDLKEHPELLKYFLKHGGQTTEQSNKISKVMHEFNEGKLKTSYGEIVTDPKQAIAIALSEAGIQKEMEEGGIIEGQLHSECNDEEGCGEKFEVGQGGNTIEAERDEAVIVSEAFDNNNRYTIHGNCSQIASALNIIGGGKNFDKGASIMSADGKKLSFPQMKSEASDTDVERQLEGGSIIINRRSMADPKKYTITGTTRQIASAINSMNNNGVVIEAGAEVE